MKKNRPLNLFVICWIFIWLIPKISLADDIVYSYALDEVRTYGWPVENDFNATWVAH